MGSKNFMYYVQLHERAWGERRYLGRPDLESILNAKVVAFWRKQREERLIITVHDNLEEIEQYLLKSLTRLEYVAPEKFLILMFANRRRVKIAGLKIKFRYDDEAD